MNDYVNNIDRLVDHEELNILIAQLNYLQCLEMFGIDTGRKI